MKVETTQKALRWIIAIVFAFGMMVGAEIVAILFVWRFIKP